MLGLAAGLIVGGTLGALISPIEFEPFGIAIGGIIGFFAVVAFFKQRGEEKKRKAADAAAREAPLREFGDNLQRLADADQHLRTANGIPPLILEKAEHIIDGVAELLARLYVRKNDFNAAAVSATIENIAKKHLPGLLNDYVRLTPDMRARSESTVSDALDAIAQEVTTVTTMVDAGDLAGAEETANIMVARFGRQNFINA